MGVKGLCSAVIVGLTLCPLTVSIGTAQSVAVREESAVGTRQVLITVSAKDAPLANVLRDIAAQVGLAVAFPVKVSQSPARVSITVHEMPLDQVLAKVLEGTGFKATVASGGFVFSERESATGISVAQGGISGKVVDGKTRQGLRGATISLVGTHKGTTTNDEGTFRIPDVAPGNYTVSVRMLGYVKITKSVTITDGQTVSIEVAMEPSVNALDQVVVTGTVTPTELKAVPNAMTVITAKQIEERGITRIEQLFHGDVPGLFVSNQGSLATLDEVVMFSRGATALSGGSSAGTVAGVTNVIKTYVDGVELADARYLSQIDPTSIERIEILSGPQASTVYGSNAINGVMQIFTKRGTTTRPTLTAAWTTGLIQSDWSPSMSPEHVADGRLEGVERNFSYNVGGSWNYLGAWAPGKQTQRVSGFGGGRLALGALTIDVSARQGLTRTEAAVSASEEGYARLVSQGVMYSSTSTYNAFVSRVYSLIGRTTGMTVTYRPTNWWSHELMLGTDVSSTSDVKTGLTYRRPTDSLLAISRKETSRSSQRYGMTLQLPLATIIRLNLSMGADHWRTTGSSWSATPLTLTGNLTSPSVTRTKPGKNSGGYVQGQLGVWDALFLTYGMRADWNPTFGDQARVLPGRYGLSYTRDFNTPLGPLSAKLRGSYGRSIRPPQEGQKEAVAGTVTDYLNLFGRYDVYAANPELGPEFQQGGEGGIELYLGSRMSLVVTRYNQTVGDLIALTQGSTDSVRSLYIPKGQDSSINCFNVNGGPHYDANGYCYALPRQYVNLGSLRNQGWELQGSVTTGPLTTRGTYSWTKSRIIGVTPKYRNVLYGGRVFLPGAPFNYLPEHTWAFGTTFSNRLSMVTLSINGTGMLTKGRSELLFISQSLVRDQNMRPRANVPSDYVAQERGYVMADLNATHRFFRSLDGVLQVTNLTNHYQNDYSYLSTSIGRQTRMGLRLRL